MQNNYPRRRSPSARQRQSVPRNIHIAHRRTPSELTPLIIEQLALQQQFELLQQQQQQLLAQHQQQLATAAYQGVYSPPPPSSPPSVSTQNSHVHQQNLIPIQQIPNQHHPRHLSSSSISSNSSYNQQNPQQNNNNKHNSNNSTNAPASFLAPNSAFGQFPAPPGHRRAQSSSMGPPSHPSTSSSSGHHSHHNSQSSPPMSSSPLSNSNISSSSNSTLHSVGKGHARRHSLGLAEAKRAAAQAQVERNKDSSVVATEDSTLISDNSNSNENTSDSQSSDQKSQASTPPTSSTPSFKFPLPSSRPIKDASPPRPSRSTNSTNSTHTNNNSSSRNRGSHSRSNSRNYNQNSSTSGSVPSFKFPDSPSSPSSSNNQHHDRSHSFNFSHSRSNSRNSMDKNWRNTSNVPAGNSNESNSNVNSNSLSGSMHAPNSRSNSRSHSRSHSNTHSRNTSTGSNAHANNSQQQHSHSRFNSSISSVGMYTGAQGSHQQSIALNPPGITPQLQGMAPQMYPNLNMGSLNGMNIAAVSQAQMMAAAAQGMPHAQFAPNPQFAYPALHFSPQISLPLPLPHQQQLQQPPSLQQQSFLANSSNTLPLSSQQRKSLFAPYLPQSVLPQLLSEGRLVAGVLRVNKKNRSDAYVSTDGLLDADIFICGSKDRNRALEGDLVAIELLTVDEVWNAKREKEEKKKRKDEENANASSNTNSIGSISTGTSNDSSNNSTDTSTNDSFSSNGNGGLKRRGSLRQRPLQKKNDDVEVEGQDLLLTEEEELSDEQKPLYAGHVVAIIDRVSGQLFSGTLGLLRPSSQATKDKQDAERNNSNSTHSRSHSNTNSRQYSHASKPSTDGNKPKIVWFKPTDKRVPLIAIPTEQAPSDFVSNPEKYTDRIFVASIKRWPITSLHPFGTLIEELGPVEKPEVKILSILRDNNFVADRFSESLIHSIERDIVNNKSIHKISALPSSSAALNDSIPKDLAIPLNGRADFRKRETYVFNLNPKEETLDMAFQLDMISDSTARLTVHILDIVYYMSKLNTPLLDKEARKRSTAIYLVQKEIKLFPVEFARGVGFSLGNGDRASIYVSFDINMDSLEIISEPLIGRGLISLDYVISNSAINSILEFFVSDTSSNSLSDSKGSQKVDDNADEDFPKVLSSSSCSDADQNEMSESLPTHVQDKIKTLSKICEALRRRRYGLDIDSPAPDLRLLDQLDDELVPVFSNIFETNPAILLINEISVQTNAAVAKKLYDALGDIAFLRRHSTPSPRLLDMFEIRVHRLGIEINTSSSESLNQGLFAAAPSNSTKDIDIRRGLQTLLVKSTCRAKYYVPERVELEQMGHYMLNLPLYTHFNAPLRRYADLIVHRQLSQVLDDENSINNVGNSSETSSHANYTALNSTSGFLDSSYMDPEALVKIAEQCNAKKDSAQNAQLQSIHLFLCQVIDAHTRTTGQLIRDAIVISVYESAFDVLIPDFGIEKRVHCDQLPLEKAEYIKENRVLELYWEKGVDSATFIPEDERHSTPALNPSSSLSRQRGRVRSSSFVTASTQQNQDESELYRQMSTLSVDDVPKTQSNVSDINTDAEESNFNLNVNHNSDTGSTTDLLDASEVLEQENDQETTSRIVPTKDITSVESHSLASQSVPTSPINRSPSFSTLAQDASSSGSHRTASLTKMKKVGTSNSDEVDSSMEGTPKLRSPKKESHRSQSSRHSSRRTVANEEDPLAPYLENVITRVEGGNFIQEIRELQHVPILVRADVGKSSLPCLTWNRILRRKHYELGVLKT